MPAVACGPSPSWRRSRRAKLPAARHAEDVEQAREDLLARNPRAILPADAGVGATRTRPTTRWKPAVALASTRRRRAGRSALRAVSRNTPPRKGSTSPSGASMARRCANACSPDFPTISPNASTAARCAANLSTTAGACWPRERHSASPLFVAAEISEIEGRGGEINVCSVWPRPSRSRGSRNCFRTISIKPRGGVREQAKRVVARRERRFRDLVLEAKAGSDDVPRDEAAALLTKEVLAGPDQDRRLGRERGAVDHPREPARRMVSGAGGQSPDRLRPCHADRADCYGETSARGVKEKAVMPILRDWLTANSLP